MAEFDDKLNSMLSNPEAMAQIMQIAKSLSGRQAQQMSGDKTTGMHEKRRHYNHSCGPLALSQSFAR